MDKAITVDLSTIIKKGSDLLKEKGPPLCLVSGIPILDAVFSKVNFSGKLLEFGAPPGHMGRVLPLLMANSLGKKCLWILEETQQEVYSKFFDFLGLDKNRFFFLSGKQALRSMKTVLSENTFSVVLLDSTQFISKADLSFISSQARKNQATYFIIRHFFLTHRLGNPFIKYRLNSSYSFSKDSLRTNAIKGLSVRLFYLKLSEVSCE